MTAASDPKTANPLAQLPVWVGGAQPAQAPGPREDGFGLILGLNALVSLAIACAAVLLITPLVRKTPSIAVLDVAELYRLKEAQVTALLVEPRTTDEQRVQALRQVTGFGQEVAALMQKLPESCNCLVLARGSVLARTKDLPDLTDEARKLLGL